MYAGCKPKQARWCYNKTRVPTNRTTVKPLSNNTTTTSAPPLPDTTTVKPSRNPHETVPTDEIAGGVHTTAQAMTTSDKGSKGSK